jgi:hypothetical protein
VSRSCRQALEPVQVELLGGEVNDVSRRACLDRRRRVERLAELRDLPLHLRDRRDGRRAPVEIVREPVDRDDAVRIEKQDRECRALLRAPESNRAVLPDLERPQDAEVEHSGGR